MGSEVAQYLRALVAEARAVLGRQLVGAYAGGSVALGAYEPGPSDVDVALVCASALSRGVKRELVGSLRHESLACPARGSELVVYRRAAAASGTAEPAFELELNTGARMDFRATLRPGDRPVEDGLFWYGLDRSVLHRHGLRLLGPPAGAEDAVLGAIAARSGDRRRAVPPRERSRSRCCTRSPARPRPGAARRARPVGRSRGDRVGACAPSAPSPAAA